MLCGTEKIDNLIVLVPASFTRHKSIGLIKCSPLTQGEVGALSKTWLLGPTVILAILNAPAHPFQVDT